jgi:hypothetical protein
LGVTVANEDLSIDNFRTINAMTTFIMNKKEPAH